MASLRKTAPNDEYYTPKWVWESITDFIPKDMEIWEAFYPCYSSGKSDAYCQSANALRELGFRVKSVKCDFFESNFGDIVVSNIPFSLKKKVFVRLKALNKPFIVLCPALAIHTSYLQDLFGNNLSLIIPNKRINFDKLNTNTGMIEKTKRANFECFFYCYKVPTLEAGRIYFSKKNRRKKRLK